MKYTRVVLISVLLVTALSAAGSGDRQKIDLNTAGLSQLDSLPGIGPAMAERILRFRIKNGPFKRIEDLMNVTGIGEKRFLKLKDRITVNRPPPNSRSSP